MLLYCDHIFSAQQHICSVRYMLSPLRLSVLLSITWVYHAKMVEVRITKFPPYGSPIPLVFVG